MTEAKVFGPNDELTLERLVGDGIAVVHATGVLVHRTLKAKQGLRICTDCLIAMTPQTGCQVSVSDRFGNPATSIATVTGPGELWLQSNKPPCC